LTQLRNPRGIYVDSNFTVYIADTANHRVLRWDDGKVFICCDICLHSYFN